MVGFPERVRRGVSSREGQQESVWRAETRLGGNAEEGLARGEVLVGETAEAGHAGRESGI